MTVWYQIDHPDFLHCKDPMTFVGGLREQDAERVARNLYNELLFILGNPADGTCKAKVLVWAE
jgi:hypothetical protein